MQSQGPQFLVIGAGSRGNSYARSVTVATSGIIAAVAEPDDFKRRAFGKKYIWHNELPHPGQEFVSWQDWLGWEVARLAASSDSTVNGDSRQNITGVFICTMDETHADIIRALAPLNLHIMCEKPLALSLSDCLSISHAFLQSSAQKFSGDHSVAPMSATSGEHHGEMPKGNPKTRPSKIFSVGHVLRYSPHNKLLRKLLLHERAIGEVVSIEHTEPVGWWHFSHSYVRGNWRRSTPEGVGSLLTKSCHDIDFLLWLLCSPPNADGKATPHLPRTIASTGALTHFRKARKPTKAGTATNCLSCAAEPECNYSAKKIYRDRWLREKQDTGWPLKIVIPEIEDIVSSHGWDAAEAKLMEKLGEDYGSGELIDEQVASRGWYGRCVYESDNDVMDEQVVTMSWEDDPLPEREGRGPKMALFHMTYPTQAVCERRGRIYGSHGEISYDSKQINVYTFADDKAHTRVIPKQDSEVEKSHGGGDFGLAQAFVEAVQKADSGELSVEDAQRRFVGCDLDEIIMSHAVVFAAEESRMGKKVVDFQTWWAQKLSEHERSASAQKQSEDELELCDGLDRLKNE
jgi:predicted dehydrogenase